MTNLFQLFQDATSAAPPSGLSVEDVFTAMRSRRQRRLRNAVAATAAVATAAAMGLVWTAGPGGRSPEVAAVRGPLIWAARGDATHLYLVRDTCGADRTSILSVPTGATPGPRRMGCGELLASSDGGVSWVSRGTTSFVPTVLGPLTLVRITDNVATEEPTADFRLAVELSVDGGAGWSRMLREGAPIGAVPPGGVLAGGYGTALTAFDPEQRRLRMLAHQPVLLRDMAMTAVAAPSGIWVTGLHRQTQRPSVAVSHDGGATWIERELPGAPVVALPMLPNGEIDPNSNGGWGVEVIAGDGDTAYATLRDRALSYSPGTEGVGRLRTYRTTDRGLTWQAVADRPTTPLSAYAWLATGGRIVLLVPGRGGDSPTFTYATSTDGVTYASTTPPGLPSSAAVIDGSIAHSDSAVYASDDGWTWREVWRA